MAHSNRHKKSKSKMRWKWKKKRMKRLKKKEESIRLDLSNLLIEFFIPNICCI